MPKHVAILNNKVSALSDEIRRRKQLESEEGVPQQSPPTDSGLGDGIILASPDGHVTFLNSFAESLTGWKQADALGKPVEDILRFTEQESDPPPSDDQHTAACQSPWPQVFLLRRDGSTRLVALHITAIAQGVANKSDESNGGSVIALRDVPDDRHARRHEELRAADVRKEEFLAMLAHELRNPLAPIRSGLDLLGLDPTASQETVDLMKHQVDYLVRLVDDLLDVSRIVQGKVRLRREWVELSQVVRRAVDSVNFLFQRREQKLIISLPADPVLLYADSIRLTQVLGNLLNNASKFTATGGRIELTAEPEGKMVLIRVRDNGMGINRHMLTKVFDLFTQGASSIDRSESGLGIGLTLVKSLVELHGGTVQAASDGLGKGTVFTVALPLMDPPKPTDAPPAAPVAHKPRRILVVDDNVGAAKMLSLLLSRLGPHDVRTAHDGKTTFVMAEEFHPDIIFLDIGLPTMDGFEVARRIRANDNIKDVLLVAVTGYGQDEDRRRSREAGFDEHLVKPVDVDSLRQMFNHAKLDASSAPG